MVPPVAAIKARRNGSPEGRGLRLAVLGGVLAVGVVALAWVWLGGGSEQAPTPEVQSRADKIAETLRKANPEPAPAPVQAPPAPGGGKPGGPTNLRQRPQN